MEIDMRKHEAIRAQVNAGCKALLVQARQIWGDKKHPLDEIAVRLMVGVGDIARKARDGKPHGYSLEQHSILTDEYNSELKKELGNVIFSMIRWIDDLGFDALECLDLAVNAQESFAKSRRPR